jgi:phospholipid/cholesterol/gamma-HCH transport system permease protein
MPNPWYTLDADDPAQPVLRLSGAWRMAHLSAIEHALATLHVTGLARIDGRALEQIDSAGALVLLRTLHSAGAAEPSWDGFDALHLRIIERVRHQMVTAPAAPPLRRRELMVQLGQAGVNAIPVVALVTFLIGVVIAYLLGLQAEQYGANIFVVDGVGLGPRANSRRSSSPPSSPAARARHSPRSWAR